MSKPRTGIPGVPGLGGVVNESAHGEAMATKRYGGGTRHPDIRTGDETGTEPQRAGDVNNLQSPGYKNDCRNDWRRAAGESAEQKPGYVKGYRVPYGDDHRHDSVEDQGGPPLRTGHSLHPYGTDGGQLHGQGGSPFSTAYHQQQGRKGPR